MIIIVEGADKTGKSTLVEQIQKQHPNFSVIHTGPPKTNNPAREYARELLKRIKAGENVIYDRMCLGELVYGPLIRGTTMPAVHWKTLLRIINKYGILIIGVDAPELTVRQRLAVSKNEAFDADTNIAALMQFKAVFDAIETNRDVKYFMRVSYTFDDDVLNRYIRQEALDKIYAMVCTHINDAIPRGNSFVGNIHGKVVIIGESLNKRKSLCGLPFDGGFTGDIVAAITARLPEKFIMYMNQDKLTAGNLRFIRDKHIICLGTKAYKKVLNYVTLGKFPAEIAKLRMHRFEHPAYVYRFDKAGINQYIIKVHMAISRALANAGV